MLCCKTKTYLVFVPGSWNRAPKTLEISWVIKCLLLFMTIPWKKPITEFMLMRWHRLGPLDSLRMGLATRKTQWLERGYFQPRPLASRKGRASRLVNTLMCCWEGGMLREGMEAQGALSHIPCSMHSFHLIVLSCILYNKLVNVTIFLSSGSHCRKLLKLRR